MVALLDSDDLDNEEQFDVFVLLAIKEGVERDHSQCIDEEPGLEVPLGNFC